MLVCLETCKYTFYHDKDKPDNHPTYMEVQLGEERLQVVCVHPRALSVRVHVGEAELLVVDDQRLAPGRRDHWVDATVEVSILKLKKFLERVT